jgi:hypothetical protein
MTISTPMTKVVEIDGLWFRFQKYRGRRSSRAAMSLTDLLGAGVITLFASPQFEAAGERERIETLGKLIAAAAMTGGKVTNPDVFERHASELFIYTPGHGGQGVSYAETKLDPTADGWVPMVNLGTLDPYDWVDFQTHLAVLWEIIKMMMRPTLAGTGTSAGTAPADGTPSAASTGPTTGSLSTPTPKRTGAIVV